MRELIDRLRAWARRYEPRSQERTLMLAAAEHLEGVEARIDTEVRARLAERADRITAEAVEKAMGARLFPWQKAKLAQAKDEA